MGGAGRKSSVVENVSIVHKGLYIKNNSSPFD
jgi:hypothetical protein